MNPRNLNLIWGIALVAAGGLFLAQNLKLIQDVSPLVWILFFSGLSLVFFASYFMSGIKQWWWLLPAMVSGAIALTISLGEVGVTSSAMGAPILLSICVPFLVAYAVEPQKNGWALIPGWIMGLLTVITLIADRVQGELIGSLVLFGIGLPFLAVYLRDRTRWWALIPGGIMTVIGFIPMLTLGFSETAMGSVVMFLFALAFLVVYFLAPKAWWAMIPAGFFLTIGVVVMIVGDSDPDGQKAGLITGILFLGWAATFFTLWLRRISAPTAWAIYPAAALAVIGVVAVGLGTAAMERVWPLALIAVGVFILFRALRRSPGAQ